MSRLLRTSQIGSQQNFGHHNTKLPWPWVNTRSWEQFHGLYAKIVWQIHTWLYVTTWQQWNSKWLMLDQQNPKSLNLSVINLSDLEVHDIVMTKCWRERCQDSSCQKSQLWASHNTIKEMVQSKDNVKPRSTIPEALIMFGLYAENRAKIFNAVADSGCSGMEALDVVPGNFLEAVKVEHSVLS